MRAWKIESPTGPQGLRLVEVPDPACGDREVRVAVRASALNRADLLQTRGAYPAPPGYPPDLPGLEFSGEVESMGAAAFGVKVGDRVMGLIGGGAWAEKVVVHPRELAPIPKGMAMEEAAAIPEAFLTAWDALVTKAQLKRGDEVLIDAATSGVGTAAAQICSALQARAIGASRDGSKLARVRGLAASVILAEGVAQLASEVRTLTNGGGVHIALDMLGGVFFDECAAALAPDGTLILLGLMAGSETRSDLRKILAMRMTIIGTMMRSRFLEARIALAQELATAIVPLFEAGELTPVVGEIFSMRDAPRALEAMASNSQFGKTVLTWA